MKALPFSAQRPGLGDEIILTLSRMCSAPVRKAAIAVWRRVVVVLMLVLATFASGCRSVSHGLANWTPINVDAPVELERTWRQGWGYMPAMDGVVSGPLHTFQSDSGLAVSRIGQVNAVVVYMHGCDGLYPRVHEAFWRRLAALGIAIVMPDSFAREGRVAACGRQPADVYAARLAELEYARTKLGEIPWAKYASLIVYGHSEGAIAVSRYRGSAFDAAVLTGYGCRRFELMLPTLAMLSKEDATLFGHHCIQASQRLLLEGRRHDVLALAVAQDRFIDFVLERINKS